MHDLVAVVHALSLVAVLIIGLSRYDAYSTVTRWVTFSIFVGSMVALGLLTLNP